jgi:tetratricopeptide (TPR) repeat protein
MVNRGQGPARGTPEEEAINRALVAAVAHINAGRLDEAIKALEDRGRLALRSPAGNNILGNIYIKQKRNRHALKAFEAAIRMVPSFPEAHVNRGVALQELGRFRDALAAHDRALRYRPDYPTAHFNRANVLKALGRFDEAIASYGKAIDGARAFPEALLNRGMTLMSAGKPLDALADFRQALVLKPGYVEALIGQAGAQRQLGQIDEALSSVNAVLAEDAASVEALILRASLWMERDRFTEAIADAEIALRQDPASARAHSARALALFRLRRFNDALSAVDRALSLQPDDAESQSIRSIVLGEVGRFEEQLEAIRRAAGLGARGVLYLNSRAAAMTAIGRFAEARADYKEAIALKPDDVLTRYNYAMFCLFLGEFERGWQEYEWRIKQSDYKRADFDRLAPRWTGEALNGRKLLVFAEQGYGDTFQFLRFLRLIDPASGEITLVAPSALRRFLTRDFPGIDVADTIGLRSGFDFQVSLMSLPLVFGTTLASLPGPVPYLTPDEALVAKWRQRIGEHGFRIGVAWQGNPEYGRDHYRSVPLRHFEPLSAIPGVRLISIQAVNGLDQLKSLPRRMKVETLGAEVTNNPEGLSEIAAVIANLDLLVTSDTGTAHLCGALGRPVFVALSDRADWRWMYQRADSPWYPTMRLFRQKAHGDWPGVFGEIAAEVTRLSTRSPR